MLKFLSLVSGMASSLLQYFQPLEKTWIGHDSWAPDNLIIASYIGAPIGLGLFFFGPFLPRWLQPVVVVAALLAFVSGMAISGYWSTYLDSVPRYSDQLFYRDVVWKFSHVMSFTSLTIFLFGLSLIKRP